MTHHVHSHKHLLGTPPPKLEESLRKIMADVFKKQKEQVVQDLPGAVKDLKSYSLSDMWNEVIVNESRDTVVSLYRIGGEKALASIRKFPKKEKGGYSHNEVSASIPIAMTTIQPVLEGTDKAVAKSFSVLVLKDKATLEVPEWLDDPDVLEAIEAEQFAFAEAINKHTADALREELLEGMENGETIDQLTERIEALYEDWQGFRAERIARTESARAYSNGHIEAWKSTGVVKNKVWVAAADACPFCLDMDGTVIPLEDTFMDEGEDEDVEWGGRDITLSQNYGDVNGPPLHPNCRCALVGQLDEDAEKMLSQKGDTEGHPFRGNQWTGAGGSSYIQNLPSKIKRFFPEDSSKANNGMFVARFEVNKELRKGIESGYRHPSYRSVVDIDGTANALELATTEYAATLNKDTILYRGVSSNFVNKLKEGRTIVDKGYIYATFDKKMAEEYMGKKGGALIQIDVSKGQKGAFGFADQSEFVFPRGSQMKIMSVSDKFVKVKILNEKDLERKTMLTTKSIETNEKSTEDIVRSLFVWEDQDVEVKDNV